MLDKILKPDGPKSAIIIRLMVGSVFLSEGIQKFLFSNELGAGRFTKIGLPNPEFLGPFVGSFEILCGTLVLLGLFTRLASIPLLTIMIVAISSTKLKLLGVDGFGSMLHESRTDWSMLLGSIFLIIEGGGKWSMDNLIWKNRRKSKAS